jgi:2-polyprenyl-6-hydroxyphenyl methylase/3-demethylubiquinone-9 3-methyltransferase
MRNDLSIYDDHADEWWRPDSKWFRSLFAVNAFRLALLDDWIGPLPAGATVVDLGCGGGFFCEPFARRGARVVGCDRSFRSVAAARAHWEGADPEADPGADPGAGGGAARGAAPSYLRADVAHAPLASGCADLVLLADVLEHVDDPCSALAEAERLLKSGGRLYVNTVARTLTARLLVVHVAETLGLIPRGTHDPDRFIDRAELIRWAGDRGLTAERVVGEAVAVGATLRTRTVQLRRSAATRMAYSVLFRKVASRG